METRLTFLSLFTVCFCVGICLVRFVRASFLLLYTLTWILLVFSFMFTPHLWIFRKKDKNEFNKGAGFLKHKNSIWLLLILAVFLGGLFLSNTYILPYPHIRNFTFYKSEPVVIRGVVASFPQIKANFSSFILSAQELTWAGKIYPVCGKVKVKIFRKEDIAYADQLTLEGRLFRPYQGKNSNYSYRDYLENQGIYSILTVSKNRPIKYLGKSRVNVFKYLAYKIREKGLIFLSNNLKPTQAGIFSAMILGERSRVPLRIRRLFVQTGTVHILAISGLHVGVIAFILDLFLKVLRLRRRARYLTIIFLLILYCLLTGARPSVIRATIMAIVLLASFLLSRETQILHSLSQAALVILVLNPRQLFNLSFQLSFISVISIVCLSPLIRRSFDADYHGYSARIATDKSVDIRKKNLWTSAIKRFLSSAFSVSFAVWLGLLPFIAYYFKIISPVTILANLVVVPYLALVIALGFSLLFVGMAIPPWAPVFAAPANLSIVVLIQIVKFFNKIPWAYFYL
ncbi:MAG: ComEC family competence protein [Candidatus Omnitrophica bacterium]|nr:ComEC family competence protein [Candidatus Omnitrophota bacterium]